MVLVLLVQVGLMVRCKDLCKKPEIVIYVDIFSYIYWSLGYERDRFA
jgi:hypothetical protein